MISLCTMRQSTPYLHDVPERVSLGGGQLENTVKRVLRKTRGA